MVWRWSLAVILLLFIILSVQYNRSTPYRAPGRLMIQRIDVPDIGAPDERQHVNYVNHLLIHGTFPVFNPKDPNLSESYQSHQPPAYYLLAATWCKLMGVDPITEEGGFRLRLLNSLIGIATIIGIYFAGLWGSSRPVVGTAAAAIAGLMPMFIALHSAVSNDPLLILCCTWTLALCALSLRHGWSLRLALQVGFLVGIGLLTKTSAVALIPMIIVGLMLAPKSSGQMIHIAVILLPLLMVLPWWVRNASLYGDPLAMGAFREAFRGSPTPTQMIEMLEAHRSMRGLNPGGAALQYWIDWFGWWTLRSFFGVFSYMDIFMSDTLYRILAAISAIFAGSWILGIQKPSDETEQSHTVHVRFSLVAGCLLAVVILLYLQFNLSYFQAQARYLYPAIAPIAIGLAIGASYLTRRSATIVWLLITGLTLLNIHALMVIQQGFLLRAA